MSALGPPAFSIAAAGVWSALALSNPTLTYHFAPLIVAAAWPVTRRTTDGRVERDRALRLAASAFALTVLTTLVLWLADAMRGPTFWTEGGAVWESVAFAFVGAAWGVRVLTRARGGLFAGEADQTV
jgi:hypothetical protein